MWGQMGWESPEVLRALPWVVLLKARVPDGTSVGQVIPAPGEGTSATQDTHSPRNMATHPPAMGRWFCLVALPASGKTYTRASRSKLGPGSLPESCPK